MTPNTSDPVEPLLLSLQATANLLSIGRSTAYELVRAGELPVVRLGRSVRVPAAALRKWLDEHSEPWAGA